MERNPARATADLGVELTPDSPLAEAAATLFASLPHSQPIPVKQLAAMLKKRNLLDGDPEQIWPLLKTELIAAERFCRSNGLRAPVVYRGRDLFVAGPMINAVTASSERVLAAATLALTDSVNAALSARLIAASQAGFEAWMQAYLASAGYRQLNWLKRVEGISYASAIAPLFDKPVIVSARCGGNPIDRRGVGELRVGVEAKGCLAGVLLSAAPLSEEAERELEKPGRSISVICGSGLVSELVRTGVGITSLPTVHRYIDDAWLDDLLNSAQ